MENLDEIKILESNFQEVFEKYQKSLIGYASSILCDSDLGEDLVQEVFLKLWESRKVIQIHLSMKDYLFRSVRNLCFDTIRRKKILESYVKEQTEERNDCFDSDTNGECLKVLKQALKYLSPKRQQILQYSLLGLKNQEIAEKMGISLNTLKTQKIHAYKKLRVVMEL